MLHALHLALLARRDINELPFAEAEAGLVVDLHHADHLGVGETEFSQSVCRNTANREERIAGIDGLRKTFAYPEGGSPPSLFVLILNVVVDQAEVVTEFNGRCARDGALPVA